MENKLICKFSEMKITADHNEYLQYHSKSEMRQFSCNIKIYNTYLNGNLTGDNTSSLIFLFNKKGKKPSG